MRNLKIASLSCLLACLTMPVQGDEPTPAKQELYKQLETLLTNARLTGNFTITGKEMKDLPKEEYTILSATKTEEGEFWLLMARIKYGGKDVTVPMPIEILWAGKTPVMTLDNLTIPGLGTFSARVVLHADKYAGTWQHDKVGGHLFGTIDKVKQEAKKEEKP